MTRPFRRRQVFHRGPARRFSAAAARERVDRVRVAGRVEARTDHRGKHEGVPPVLVGECMEIGDIDIDSLAGLDIGDFLLENVRPMLNQQACLVALVPRRAVDGLGFFLFAQDTANGTLPDDHQKPGDRGFFRQGKYIDGLDLRVERIGKLLFDPDRADMAGDGGVHGGVLQGERDLFCAVEVIVGRNVRDHRSGTGVFADRGDGGGPGNDPDLRSGQYGIPSGDPLLGRPIAGQAPGR